MKNSRPNKPTAPLIEEVCGSNHGLIASLHHGLYETPLIDVYPFIDFNELIAFEASSWKNRETNFSSFANLIDHTDNLYDVFKQVYKIGIPWLKKHSEISRKRESKYQKLNPFDGKDLGDRLKQVHPEAATKLRNQLQKRVNSYLFDIEYKNGKHRNIESRGTRCVYMHFQNAYPSKTQNIPNFAKEINRMFDKYPDTYFELETSKKPKQPEKKQYDLF
jgi:hypothetical protein